MTRWPGRLALCALCVAPAAWAADYTPLSSACEIFDRIDARGLTGIGPEVGDYIEMPLEQHGAIRLSNCTLPTSGMFGYGLLLREDTSASVREAEDQLAYLLRQLSETWGEGPHSEPVELDAPAVWIPDFHQLWILARDGHAYLIVSMPEEADAAAAAKFGAAILGALD